VLDNFENAVRQSYRSYDSSAGSTL
jgi:hypothetical protein